jgi:ATPase subunit of ABC transporter with duplicated ATPase domains
MRFMSKNIIINNLSISFGSNTYLENFSTNILGSAKIGIIGRNGSGKTSLLNAIASRVDGVKIDQFAQIDYVKQLLSNPNAQSHGECLMDYICQAIRDNPDVLILDEPTNHLDKKNREYLFRMLDDFRGTLIFVSHDVQILERYATEIWHIKDGSISIHKCKYGDYIKALENERNSIEHKLSILSKEKADLHHALMKEQVRACNSKKRGQKNIDNKKWPTVRSKTKFGRGNATSAYNKREINEKREELSDEIAMIGYIKDSKPTFHLDSTIKRDEAIVSVQRGVVKYAGLKVLKDVYLTVKGNMRIAILGDNGSGKSTLMKALISDASVTREGDWYIKNNLNIGYLDQNYSNINNIDMRVVDVISDIVPEWSEYEVREHLNGFLFKKNDEVNKIISQLSGGERARLSLAKIAAKAPDLLILDEITNNLDIETKRHMIDALKRYNGALIIVSHEDEFIESIEIDERIFI